MTDQKLPIIIGMTGASGVIYAWRLLEILRELNIPTHLIISKAAEMTIAYEMDEKTAKDFRGLATVNHPIGDIGASCASGSMQHAGMIVIPCSMNTLGEIAASLSGNLISRAAEVTLKERRRLVLLTRETPLTLQHIRNMKSVTEMGGIIAPPVPAFYAKPKDLNDMVIHSVARLLDLFNIDCQKIDRWRC